MLRSNCPNPEELRRYVLALVPEGEASRIEAHLAGCAACENTVASLELPSDTLLTALRTPRKDEGIGADPNFQTAMEKAKRVMPGAPSCLAAAATEQAASPQDIPQQLGSYRLEEKIGQGGMGVVYRAQHTRLDRPVAIKILPNSRVRFAERVARFEREMKAVGKLQHPHLVQAFDAQETPDQRYLYLVMELIDGEDAEKLLRRDGPLPVIKACRIVQQAAEGLAYVHRQGFIHRDVKPSNLMLTEAGHVKILDLGLALLAERSSEELTDSSQVMGTPEYMAPEQALDSHAVDSRADIYSLGCTLYKLLAGQSPYAADKLVRVVMAHREAPVPSLREARPDVPAELDELFGRMVAKKPQDRPQSMSEVAARLDTIIARQTALPVTAAQPRLAAGRRRRGPVWWTLLAGAAAFGLVL